MHDGSGFDFTKFVPGFDFLKNMNGGAAASAAHPAWVAPTLDPAELDKRIQELKTVHFWLDQNTKAVSATIQALEVQRMTLSALQNMNVSFGEMADALKIKPHAHAQHDDAHPSAAKPKAARKSATKAASPSSTKSNAKNKASAGPAAGVDPSQWWGALTQQFQNIANTAMHEMAKNAETHPGAPTASAQASDHRAASGTKADTTRTSVRKTTSKRSSKAAQKSKRG